MAVIVCTKWSSFAAANNHPLTAQNLRELKKGLVVKARRANCCGITS